MNIYKIYGTVGSGFMIAFSFTLQPTYGVVGLAMLTFQACNARLWNLVILNIVSIIGLFLKIIA